jgi:hypothetical protein
MKIAFFINAPQNGLLCSMGKEIEKRGHEPVFLARDSNVADVILRHFPKIPAKQLVVLDKINVSSTQIVSDCLVREDIYKENFAMLCSHDRGLGKGYLLNAPSHPEVIKAWWSKEKKFTQLLNEFLRYEKALDILTPEIVVSVAISKVAHLICRHRGISVKILTPPRFGSLYYWATDEYANCPELNQTLVKNVASFEKINELPEVEYEQTKFAQYFFGKINFSHFSAIRSAAYRVLRESYQMLRKTHTSFSEGYSYLSWNGPILRKPRIYNYFCKYGVSIKEMEGTRYVLFPLHMEPEASLLALSPELNNSIELITWISKNLPADMFVVVKEQPDSYGIRNRLYYDNLRRMANVVIAHPKIHGRDWINSCFAVATITGTMGFEAVASHKPVLSFGKHQVVNLLPTVEYADSFTSTRVALKAILDANPEQERQLKISRAALDLAFKDVCFDLSGYEKIFESQELHMELASTALANLSFD